MPTLRKIAQNFTYLLVITIVGAMATDCVAANDEPQRYYDVELVIFQNNDALRTLPELNPDPQPLTMPEHYIQLGMPDITAPPEYIPDYYFKLLPSEDYHLTDAASRIAASNDYRLLTHIAWRQPGLDSQVALPVFFQEAIPGEDMPDTSSPTTMNAEQPATPPLYNKAMLQGLITVSLSRYLHVDATLRFEADGLAPLPESLNNTDETPAVATDINTTSRPTNVVYLIQQSRRMRSKELHYIDHPVIGMLVMITPVDIPKDISPNPGNTGAIKR